MLPALPGYPLRRLLTVHFGLFSLVVLALIGVGCVSEVTTSDGDGNAASEAGAGAMGISGATQPAAASAKLSVDAGVNGTDPGTLVIYAGRSESLVAPVIK